MLGQRVIGDLLAVLCWENTHRLQCLVVNRENHVNQAIGSRLVDTESRCKDFLDGSCFQVIEDHEEQMARRRQKAQLASRLGVLEPALSVDAGTGVGQREFGHEWCKDGQEFQELVVRQAGEGQELLRAVFDIFVGQRHTQGVTQRSPLFNQAAPSH